MSEAYEIRPYRAGDETAILALFNRVFAVGNPDFVPRPLHHWQWEFAQNPEGHPTLVAEAGDGSGAIVGTFTAIPTRFRFPDGIFRLGQAVDTVVAPEFRRSLRKQSLYLAISHAWYERFGRRDDVRFLWGLPNPQAFRIGTRHSGYEPVRCPVLESELPLEAAARFDGEGIEVAEIERFGGELGRFDAALSSKGTIANVRDARYWNWRYPDCPTTRYRLLRAESSSGRLRGFLVHGFSWHGFRKEIVPIVDWVIAPGDLPCWRALLSEAARGAARDPMNGAGTKLTQLLAWAPPFHGHFADLAALGFRSKESIFNLCIRRFPDSDITPEAARDSLYVNMGDSDVY